MKVAYFFLGISRKASIANFLKLWCEEEGFGLIFYEVDILVGGSSCDLMDMEKQEDWLSLVESGEFEFVISSPLVALPRVEIERNRRASPTI